MVFAVEPTDPYATLSDAQHAPQSDAPDSILRLVRQATRRVDALRTG